MTLPVYRTVDDALNCVPRFHPTKTMSEIAAEMGWTCDELSKATNPNEKPRFAAAWIVPLTHASGDFAIVRTICKLVGGVFFQPRRATRNTTHSASTLKEFADYLATLAKHEANGFTKCEVDDLDNEVHDVISCLLSHVDKLRAEAK